MFFNFSLGLRLIFFECVSLSSDHGSVLGPYDHNLSRLPSVCRPVCLDIFRLVSLSSFSLPLLLLPHLAKHLGFLFLSPVYQVSI